MDNPEKRARYGLMAKLERMHTSLDPSNMNGIPLTDGEIFLLHDVMDELEGFIRAIDPDGDNYG